MEVEMGKAGAPETPASIMVEQLMENVTSIMMLCGGIESISATKYNSGFGSRLHVTISHFANVPNEVKEQGIIIKDALAQIMSIANVTRIVTKPSNEDLAEIRKAWEKATMDANSVNEGSGQDFSGNHSPEEGA